MEFFIKKNATLPLLKLQVVKDGRSDYNRFMELIEESSIFFSMVDVSTGIPKITTKPAGFVDKVQLDPNAETEYYIYYQFASFDTNREGRYEAQFLFRNSEGTLVLPIREKLFINVQESFIADDLQYDGCYVLEYPCCGTVCTTTTTPPCPSCPCGPSITPTPTPTTTSYISPFPTPSVSPANVGPNLGFCMEVMSGSPTPTPTIRLPLLYRLCILAPTVLLDTQISFTNKNILRFLSPTTVLLYKLTTLLFVTSILELCILIVIVACIEERP